MSVDVILGLQWGDEGKGKIVDLLSKNYDIIARFQGGPNAGHTIIIGDKKYVLHQIPSGMTREGIINVIGNSVVLDPIVLLKEIKSLEDAGIDVKSRLLVSRKANLILPTHKILDSVSEKSNNGNTKVGSTLRGIGPTYQDKVGRFGLRIGDIFSKDFKSLYQRSIERHLKVLSAFGYTDDIDDKEWLDAAERMKELQVIDNEFYLNEALKQNKSILAEGAQGTLLDIDFGSYPYVTSSNTVTASACAGLGISPKQLGKVYGIFKAYATRVGEGPFPSELHDETGQMLREKGFEFGSTTGRPRRCGWLDLKALEYAIMLNGVDELFMMKIDVLNEFEEISLVNNYKTESESDNFASLAFGNTLEPELKSFKGWQKDLGNINQYGQLPEEAKQYIQYIEKAVNVPVSLISTGPERTQTIMR